MLDNGTKLLIKPTRGTITAARILLNGHLEEFRQLFERRKIERAFGALPQELKRVKERALTQVYRDQIANLSPDAQCLILEIASYMEKKCVAVPMKMAKEKIG